MDIMLTGKDQSQADQPDSLAEGPPAVRTLPTSIEEKETLAQRAVSLPHQSLRGNIHRNKRQHWTTESEHEGKDVQTQAEQSTLNSANETLPTGIQGKDKLNKQSWTLFPWTKEPCDQAITSLGLRLIIGFKHTLLTSKTPNSRVTRRACGMSTIVSTVTQGSKVQHTKDIKLECT
eukprot:1159720-Pelagomonas_calceolata.AAC.1